MYEKDCLFFLKITFKYMGKRMKKEIWSIMLVLLIALSGCATYYNPVTGKQEKTLYSEQEEKDLGKAANEKILREYKVLSNPDAYYPGFTRLCAAIAAQSGRPTLSYSFGIIEKNEINAFSLPGGYIYVYTGLLAKIKNEDELAGVIGHELSHIEARDALKKMEAVTLYTIPAQILFGSGRQQAIQKVVDTSFNLSLLRYSRQDELRADADGARYAFQAGYDPLGMISFFQTLEKIEKESGVAGIPVFLMDHPDTQARIRNLEKVIASFSRTYSPAWKVETLR
jgi:predicted Zn-dependent protease